MRNIYLIMLSLLISPLLIADPPAGYYDSAEGLSGDALKATLNDIISGHTQYSYNDLRDFILPYTDEDTLDTDNVILIYTGRSQPKSSFGGGANDWNREHVWAKSRGDFNETPPCGTDAHMLHPCDGSVNSSRGNKDFDNGGSAVYDLGYLAGYSDADSWEPRDEVKGDVARVIFYMATRYEGEIGELDLELVDYIQTIQSNEPYCGKLSSLYQWNLDDPPDNWERLRNDRVYYWQNNRNPYVDHPEYITYIWGDEVPEDNIPPTISDVIVLGPTNIVIDFSEYVEQISAETISNYSIDNGIGVPLTAALGYNSDNSKVLLNVDMLTPAVSYTITINNVEDLNENEIAANSQYVFEMTAEVELLNESFEAGTSGWTLYSVTSDEDWHRTNSTAYAHPSSVPNGNYYMYINNYNSDAPGNDWLISPELDLTEYATLDLSFYSWNQYSDIPPGLEAKYSTTYNGSSDPSSYSWTNIPVTLSALGSSTWTLEDGEDLSILAGLAGVYMAFHYTSTGTSGGSCRAWAIDNVILTAELNADPQLATPQNLGISYSGNTITLTWDTVSGATSYKVYSSTDPYAPEGEWQLVATVTDVTHWTSAIGADRKFYRITAN